MERRDQVVVLLARLVIEQYAFLQSVSHELGSDLCVLASRRFRLILCEFRGYLEHVVSGAGISTGIGGDFGQCFVFGFNLHRSQSTLVVFESTAQKDEDLLFRKRLKGIDAAAREQSRDDFKRGILGGCTNQTDIALFNVR